MVPDPFFLAAFLATTGSVIWLTNIAVRHHTWAEPKTLSELAVVEDRVLAVFRKTLFVCASLFAISIYGFIGPRLENGISVVATWTWIYINILLTATLPMRGKTFWPHVITAQFMGVGMLVLAYLFWKSLEGGYATAELIAAIIMTVLALLTYADKRRFIVYELAFIYMNNVTIVIAAVAVSG